MTVQHSSQLLVSVLVMGILVAGCAATTSTPAPPVTIWTTNQLETKTKALLTRLLAEHDLSDYTFTDKVVVTYDTNPHSHQHIGELSHLWLS